jgi:enamine deaminase RidA (YjgF/YER057c/UK114 family)
MTTERRLSPEEEELRTKQTELDGLLDRLAQNELEPETLHADINSFFTTDNAAVLPKVAEAKGLRARIAQAIYVLDPTDTARSESQEARSSADEAEGGSPGDIVKITTYVTSINDWRASALERQSLFNEYFKGEYPADTLVEITALAEPEDRVGQR